jgi:hypothetical protein
MTRNAKDQMKDLVYSHTPEGKHQWTSGDIACAWNPAKRDKDSRKMWVEVYAAGKQIDQSFVNLHSPSERQRFYAGIPPLDGLVSPNYWLQFLASVGRAIADMPDSDVEHKTLRVCQLSTVAPERVEFFWKPYLPEGRSVAIEGDPGGGKSNLIAKICAHMTTGHAFPTVLDHQQPNKDFAPRNVCLFTSEDDPGDTIRPRIALNEGNVERVFLIEGWEQTDGTQGIITLQDLALLREVLQTYEPAMLVFDPMQAFFGRGADMNSANDTRPILDAVAAICKPYKCTPLYVRHVGKTKRDKAIHSAIGSIDITGAMRSILFLAADPDQEDRRIIAHSKSNNALKGKSLAFRIREVEEAIESLDGQYVTVSAPRVDWDGISTLTANDLSAPMSPETDEKPALEQAKEFLHILLADGPVLAKEVEQQAKDNGVTWATLRRAKANMDIGLRKRTGEGKNSQWEWFLKDIVPF